MSCPFFYIQSKGRPMKKNPKALILGALAVVLIILGVVWYSNSQQTEKESGIETVTLTKQEPLAFDGKVKFKTDDTYTLTQGSQVLETKVKNNQEVKKGDVLFTMVSPMSQSPIEARAKNSGVVTLNTEAENDPTLPFVRVNSKEVEISAEASEFDRYAIKKDQTVNLEVKATGDKMKGKVLSISSLPQSEKTSMSTQGRTNAKYDFIVEPEKDILAGYSVTIFAPLDGFIVPNEALIKEDNKTYVYIDDNGKAKKLEVKTAKQGRNLVLLEDENIKANIKVVSNAEKIKEGQSLEEGN